jgi:hypothetical protein
MDGSLRGTRASGCAKTPTCGRPRQGAARFGLCQDAHLSTPVHAAAAVSTLVNLFLSLPPSLPPSLPTNPLSNKPAFQQTRALLLSLSFFLSLSLSHINTQAGDTAQVVKLFKELGSAGANFANSDGFFPLHCAAFHGRSETAVALVRECGVDANGANTHGVTSVCTHTLTHTLTHTHMYRYMYLCMYIRTYAHTYVPPHTQMYVCTYPHTHRSIYIYMHTHVHMYIHTTCVCIYITYTYAYTYTCVYTYMHIHTYIYIQVHI